MANEIILNEEDVEVYEMEETSGTGNGWKIAGGAALLAAVCFGAYKAGKWAKAKIAQRKAKKAAAQNIEGTTCDVEACDND